MPDTTISGVDTSGFGELEELFKYLIHKSPLGIFLYALDEQGELIFRGTNQTASDLLGINCHHLIGKTIERAFPLLSSTEIPAVYKKLAAQGGNWTRQHIEYKDKRVRGAYSVHAFQTSPGRMATVFLDITSQKKAEQDLQQANASLLAAIDATPAGVVIIDAANSAIRLMNAAARAILHGENGLSTEAPPDGYVKDWQTLYIDGTPYNEEQTPLGRAIFNGEVVENEELIVVRKDLKRHTVLTNAAPIRNDRGEVTAGVVVFLDISEQKKAENDQKHLEAQMQHAQKLESLGVLAGGIAHDFNNLLCAILGGADLALNILPADHIARDSLAMVHDTAQRATELCQQMLAYSGKGKFQAGPLDMSDLIRGMERLLKVSVTKKTSLHFVTPEHLPYIEADATQIRQIILNLVVNASEALGDRGGMVAVRTGVTECDEDYLLSAYLDNQMTPGRYVFVEVSDTGRGMDKTTRSRLFDPFYTTKQTGRGLGLAAVLGIVRGHSGSIKVYSEPDQGSSFKVLFPVSNKKKVHVPAPVVADHHLGEELTVLLVDDEPSVRQVGKLMLERLGCRVLTAVDGKDGLDVYMQNEKEIQLIILDMTMPRMNGEETFRELRRMNPLVRVILTSGYNAQDATSHFAGKGLSGFMQKPFQLKTMRQCVNKAVESPVA